MILYSLLTSVLWLFAEKPCSVLNILGVKWELSFWSNEGEISLKSGIQSNSHSNLVIKIYTSALKNRERLNFLGTSLTANEYIHFSLRSYIQALPIDIRRPGLPKLCIHFISKMRFLMYIDVISLFHFAYVIGN